MSGLRERIAEVDASDQLGDVLALPDHVLDALWRFESAGSRPAEAAGLVVAGMGGSAIGAELARAALGDRLSLPLRCVRGYSLEPWTTPRHAVLCLSYSGDTEETLACFEAAEALGAPRYVATTGGALAAA
ncbi:MAG: bifunctional phosphoglucose/phosphomannose isomerase, partial [Solirubrobacterales bacterium]|nr:bifunctional phosphoglucose/phosphomannose isomerase [Solirubrobacterales bacterium]